MTAGGHSECRRLLDAGQPASRAGPAATAGGKARSEPILDRGRQAGRYFWSRSALLIVDDAGGVFSQALRSQAGCMRIDKLTVHL